MKKLLAIALAALMLLASAACAESAVVTTISDPVLTMAQGDEAYYIDMAGLQIALAMGLSGETPTIQADVTNGDESLLGAVIQIADGALLFDVDGVSNTYKVAMGPDAVASQAQQGYDALFANLGALKNLRLPGFQGVAIPKIDLTSLLSIIITDTQVDESGAQVSAIELPYETINGLLAMAAPYLNEAAQNAGVGDVADLIDQLQQSNSGISIGGSIVDSGDTVELIAYIYLVIDGQTNEEPLGALYVVSQENAASLSVLLYDDGDYQTVGSLSVTSSPAEAILAVDLDMLGEMSFHASLYPDAGLQIGTVEIDFGGETISFTLGYGQQDGQDVFALNAAMPGTFDVGVTTATTADANGDETGTLSVDAEADGIALNLSADIAAVEADVALRDVADAANAIDVETLDDAANEQFGEELQNAVTGLIQYFNTLEPQAAA